MLRNGERESGGWQPVRINDPEIQGFRRGWQTDTTGSHVPLSQSRLEGTIAIYIQTDLGQRENLYRIRFDWRRGVVICASANGFRGENLSPVTPGEEREMPLDQFASLNDSRLAVGSNIRGWDGQPGSVSSRISQITSVRGAPAPPTSTARVANVIDSFSGRLETQRRSWRTAAR